MKNILFVLGTRPELIKLFPLIKELKFDKSFNIEVCVTGQHTHLLENLFDFFQFKPDYNLEVMRENQSLTGSFTAILDGLQSNFSSKKPDAIIVQGDTNSAFAGALFGYYNQIKVIHIEAGLRTGNLFSPYPEEGNRKLIGQIADFHFSATDEAANNLRLEGINENVHVVGNTVIDTLLYTINKVENKAFKYKEIFEKKGVDLTQKLILVTIHRRENFENALEAISEAIQEFATNNPKVAFIIPVHPNRNGQYLKSKLSNINGIHLIEPLPYDEFVFLMSKAYIIMSDSGGIQEESISCNKPLLVLRENTERPEVIQVGAGVLVGSDKSKILSYLHELSSNQATYESMINKTNPFGNGHSSEVIHGILKRQCSSNVLKITKNQNIERNAG